MKTNTFGSELAENRPHDLAGDNSLKTLQKSSTTKKWKKKEEQTEKYGKK